MELRATKELRFSLKTPASCSQIKKKRKKSNKEEKNRKGKVIMEGNNAFPAIQSLL
jgi:hypothetical protein